jgi:hypothetical protein
VRPRFDINNGAIALVHLAGREANTKAMLKFESRRPKITNGVYRRHEFKPSRRSQLCSTNNADLLQGKIKVSIAVIEFTRNVITGKS